MALINAVCPSCGRQVQIPEDAERASCMYCGSHIPTAAGTSAKPDLSNLLGMARTALLASNNEEALSYYNRVLEADPRNSEAWIGKGKAAGWLSTLANVRIPEAVIAFNNAVGSAPDAEKSVFAEQATSELNSLVSTIYGMANRHMHQFASSAGTWESYLVQVSILLEGLDSALIWKPRDRITLENIIHLCRDNIEGVSFRDPFNNNAPGLHSLSPEYEKLLQERLDAAVRRMREIDPSFEAPAIQKKQADACFVVTATMGDFDHPHVTNLRKFRDDVLMTSASGRSFVGWYYRHGPEAARLIRKRRIYRSVSRALLVSPAAWLATKLLKSRHPKAP